MKPQSFHLPSGARVELGAGSRIELPGIFGPELAEVRARFSGVDGRPVSLADLPLSDLACVRALARAVGLVDEALVAVDCRNCRHRFEVRPSSTLELGPFRDGELDDPELDAPFDFSRAESIPALDGGGGNDTIRLAPRTVAQAESLHRAIDPARPFRITSSVVRGMGIVELAGETAPVRIARKLSDASDRAYDAVTALFEGAHYPPRLEVPHACPECGALEWLLVPLSRELSLEPTAGEPALAVPSSESAFPSVDDFERMVREEADKAYAELGIGAVDLLVIDEAAEVDDGGEPLLGCYRPAAPDALVPAPAEIRLFYRTFLVTHEEDGPYDVRAEIAETLRHELMHHLSYLAGHDPIDDEEREQIEHEVARRVGRFESRRRATRALRTELREFVARTWVVWLIAALVTLALVLANGR